MVLVAVFDIDAWPFEPFRLFSVARTDEQHGWAAKAVAADGRELAYPIASLDRGFRGFGFLMDGFAERTQGERDAICLAWLERARELEASRIRAVRVYRLSWRLSDRAGDRAAPPRRALRVVCSGKGGKRVS